MLGMACVGRVMARGAGVTTCSVAAGARPARAVCGALLNRRELKVYQKTNMPPNANKIHNAPEFGKLEDPDIERNKFYMDWETLHPSKLNASIRQGTQAPLFSDDELTIRRMFECGVHYGHDISMWNPLMSQFLYGHRNGIHIFNLEETLKCLRVALTFIRGVAQRGGIILFVNTRPQFESIVRTTAIEAGEYYITQKWVPGIITNRLRAFEQNIKPDAVIFLSMPVSSVGIAETEKGQVPSVGICDSDCDPTKIMYPIPGNDDGIDPMRLYCSLFKSAILDGKNNPIAPPKPAVQNYGRGRRRH